MSRVQGRYERRFYSQRSRSSESTTTSATEEDQAPSPAQSPPSASHVSESDGSHGEPSLQPVLPVLPHRDAAHLPVTIPWNHAPQQVDSDSDVPLADDSIYMPGYGLNMGGCSGPAVPSWDNPVFKDSDSDGECGFQALYGQAAGFDPRFVNAEQSQAFTTIPDENSASYYSPEGLQPSPMPEVETVPQLDREPVENSMLSKLALAEKRWEEERKNRPPVVEDVWLSNLQFLLSQGWKLDGSGNWTKPAPRSEDGDHDEACSDHAACGDTQIDSESDDVALADTLVTDDLGFADTQVVDDNAALDADPTSFVKDDEQAAVLLRIYTILVGRTYFFVGILSVCWFDIQEPGL